MPKLPRKRDADYIRFPPYYVFKSHPDQRTRSEKIAIAWRLSLVFGVPSLTVVAVILLIRQYLMSA
jgi:hypothetical protein